MLIEISDIRDFIKGIEQVFIYSEKNEELDSVMKYSMIKVIVSLRIEERKLMAITIKKIGKRK